MTTISRPSRQAPALVRRSNALTSRLLRLGLPMGPNGLLTVRGRTTGEPRTAPVAVVEIDGHRYLMGAYGDVQWTRNLRAAGEADFSLHGRTEHVIARELEGADAVAFFRDTLPEFIGRLPWFGRAFSKTFLPLVGPELLKDPDAAVASHPVFELRRIG